MRGFGGDSQTRATSGSRRAFAFANAFALALAVATLAPPAAHAEEEETTGASVKPSQFDAICKETLAASPSPDATTASQKLSYCQQAATAKEGYDAGKVLFPVWTGVTVICATQCALSKTPAALAGAASYVCPGTNIAAGVTAGIVTRNMAEAFAGIASAGGALLFNKMLGTGTSAPKVEAAAPGAAGAAEKTADRKLDTGSCLAAAAAGFQAVTKFQLMKDAKESLVSALGEAVKLDSDSSDGSGGTGAFMAGGSTSSTSGSGGGSSGSTSGALAEDAAVAESTSCSGSGLSGGAIIQCAVARDGTLPGWVSTPKFQDDFQKYSGMDLGDYANQAENASGGAAALGSALARLSSGSASPALGTALADAEREAGVAGTSYRLSGGRGGMGGGGEGSEMDIAGMMSGLMAQFMPKDPNAAKQQNPASKGVFDVANATRNRGPSSVALDPSLGIFDRVSYRYLVISKFGRVDTLAPAPVEPREAGAP